MNRKTQITTLTHQLKTAGVGSDDFDDDAGDGLATKLQKIETKTMSSCGYIAVFSDGTGKLVDLVISDDAFQRLNSEEMATRIRETINQSREILNASISEITRPAQGRT